MFKPNKSLFIGLALLCTSLTGCNVVNSLRMMQINSNVEPVFSEQTRVELDAVYAGEKPYIYANVNGQKLLFLLDKILVFLP